MSSISFFWQLRVRHPLVRNIGEDVSGKLDPDEGNFRGKGVADWKPLPEKMVRQAPVENLRRGMNSATLFMIARNEDLIDNQSQEILANKRARGVTKPVAAKQIRHYGIHHEKREEARQLAQNRIVARHISTSPSGIDSGNHENVVPCPRSLARDRDGRVCGWLASRGEVQA
jgi:hypothetical protein